MKSKKINSECEICKKSILVALSEKKRGNGKFCSLKCSASRWKGNKKVQKPNAQCALCSKKFYATAQRLRKSQSGLYFCCRSHKDTAQRIGGVEAIQPEHYNNGLSTHVYRLYALRLYGAKCQRCAYDANIAAIVVHHKDRNRENNVIDNLEVLCANCHAIEHSYNRKFINQTF